VPVAFIAVGPNIKKNVRLMGFPIKAYIIVPTQAVRLLSVAATLAWRGEPSAGALTPQVEVCIAAWKSRRGKNERHRFQATFVNR